MDLTCPCFLTYLQTSHVLSTSDVYLYALRVLRFLLLFFMFPDAVPIKADVLIELKINHFLCLMCLLVSSAPICIVLVFCPFTFP